MSATANSSIAWTLGTEFQTHPQASISTDAAEKVWRDRRSDLLRIRRYRDNWDGFGADAPDPRVLDTAIEFLENLRLRDAAHPPFRATLSPNGTVGFEWQTTSEWICVEIVSTERAEWMRTVTGQRPEHWEECLDIFRNMQDGSWDGISTESAAGVAVSASIR